MKDFLRRKSDALVGAVFLLFCLLLSAEVMKIKTPESRIMPFFALGLMALSSLWLIFQTLVLGRSQNTGLLHRKRELLVWALYAALVLGMNQLGFYLSAFLFLLVCHLSLRGKPDPKGLLRGLAYSAGLVLLLFVCFTCLVKMPLPMGAWS